MITAPNVATVVLENLVIPYRAPDIISTDNGKQFPSKFSAVPCAFLGTSLVTAIEYHPQTNEQVERYNQTLVARLRHYDSKH